jgi:hypothetical protein
MNEIYQWHNEMMVTLEMENFKREIDEIRLLHDAELSNPCLYERVAIAIGKALVKLGQRLHESYTNPHQAYQITSGKYAA